MQFAHFPRDHMFEARNESRKVIHKDRMKRNLEKHSQLRKQRSVDILEKKSRHKQATGIRKSLGSFEKMTAELDGSSDTDVGLSFEHTKDFALSLFRRKGKKDRRASNPISSSTTLVDYKLGKRVPQFDDESYKHQGCLSPIPGSLPPRKESISSHSVPVHGISSSLIFSPQKNRWISDIQTALIPTKSDTHFPLQVCLECIHSSSGMNSLNTTQTAQSLRNCSNTIDCHNNLVLDIEEESNSPIKNVRFSFSEGNSHSLQRMPNVTNTYKRNSRRSCFSYGDGIIKSVPDSDEYTAVGNHLSSTEYLDCLKNQPDPFIGTEAKILEAGMCKSQSKSQRNSILVVRETKIEELVPFGSLGDYESTEESEQKDVSLTIERETHLNTMQRMNQERDNLLKEVVLLRRQLKAEMDTKLQISIALENARQQFDRISTVSFLKLKEVSKENKRLANELKALNGRVTTSGNRAQKESKMTK